MLGQLVAVNGELGSCEPNDANRSERNQNDREDGQRVKINQSVSSGS
jgi:hypothetical protein